MRPKIPKIDTNEDVWSKIESSSVSFYGVFRHYLDSKGRYFPYREFKHRVPKGLDSTLAWALAKQARLFHKRPLLQFLSEEKTSWFCLTPKIEKTLSYVDRFTTNSSLELMTKNIGEEHHFQYLFQDLIENEAISSSQLEGATTTTLMAKKMLREKRAPKSVDEKMILGNYSMMRFVWENRNRDLSLDFIREIHRVGVEDIYDAEYDPGRFRTANDVVVQDMKGEVLHYPPSFKGLEERLQNLCDWINFSNHDSDSSFVHPLVQAILVHFTIGFEHPFRDGNGRVARALFYWTLFKENYGAFRYITLSRWLKERPGLYADSYLDTEEDDLDLTYFIECQCNVILKAIDLFTNSYHDVLEENEKLKKLILNSSLLQELKSNELLVFQLGMNGVAEFNARDLENFLECSYNTAASVLQKLVDRNLFCKKKRGRNWVYRAKTKKELTKILDGLE